MKQDIALRDAIEDFERHFGVNDDLDAYYQSMNGEQIIVIESSEKRAFYTLDTNLIKVTNLREDM